MKTKIEGYWYSETCPNRPNPIPNQLGAEDAIKIFGLIKDKEKTARKRLYKGSAKSRFTGERLGSGEFETKEFAWPEQFAEHYVLKFRVKPSDEFLKFIGFDRNIS